VTPPRRRTRIRQISQPALGIVAAKVGPPTGGDDSAKAPTGGTRPRRAQRASRPGSGPRTLTSSYDQEVDRTANPQVLGVPSRSTPSS